MNTYVRSSRQGLLWSTAAVLLLLLLHSEEAAAKSSKEKGRGDLVALGDRLSPGSTVLVSVSGDEVSALTKALPFHFANVTLPEQRLAYSRSVGTAFTHELAKAHSVPLKKLRTSAIQCVERPLKIKLINDYDIRCLEGGVATLVSLTNLHIKNGKYFANLLVHSERGGIITSTNLAFSLAALNPFLWANNRPQNGAAFRGTGICLQEGGKFQVVEGWPVRPPMFKEGPWDIKVLVERAFLTPSSDKKQHLLHADLKILKVPRDVTFLQGPQPKKIPFAGYVTLPSKYNGLEAAIIRERISGKACHLRRKEAKSTVELKCDELIDAKLASLNKLYSDRPPLLRTFRGAGLLAGGSLAAFVLAAFMHMLGDADGSKPMGDPEGCVAVGIVAAIVSLLTLLVETPRVGFQYLHWRRKYNRKASRIVGRAVGREIRDPTTKGAFLDLVLVLPPAPYGSGDPHSAEESLNSSKTEGQNSAYVSLVNLMKTKAEAAAYEELQERSCKPESFGILKPPEEAVKEQIKNIKETSAETGLRFSDEGELILPSFMSATTLFEAVAEASKSLIEPLASTFPEATFAIKLLHAQLTRRNLWSEWDEMRKKVTAACQIGEQQIDLVPLSMWADIYKNLTESGNMIETAELKQEVKKTLLGVQTAQDADLRKLLEAKIQEEVGALLQLAANVRAGEADRSDIEALEVMAHELKTSLEGTGLPMNILDPINQSVKKLMEGSHSEVEDLEPLEEPTPRLQPESLKETTFDSEEDDTELEILDIDS